MDLLQRIQTDCAARLRSADYFSNVNVIVFRPRIKADGTALTVPSLQAEIDNSLSAVIQTGGKAGLAAVVYMPAFNVPEPNIPGPQGEITFTVRVMEDTLINSGALGTGKSCEDCALNVLNTLHYTELGGAARTIIAAPKSLYPVGAIDKTGQRIAIDTQFITAFGIKAGSQCGNPVIGGTQSATTLTSGTAGASIYYTLDGSYPWSGNTAAVLYSAPFAITSGQKLRAAATKPGASLRPSDVIYQQF